VKRRKTLQQIQHRVELDKIETLQNKTI